MLSPRVIIGIRPRKINGSTKYWRIGLKNEGPILMDTRKR
jgi:hypothetical protein